MQNHNGNGTAALLARGFAALWTTLIVAAPAGALAASVETVLHAFAGGGDGKTVFAGLTADGEGNLYGTTEGGGASYAGTVFELKRPASAGGTWTKTVLYDFKGGSDGGYPARGLIADSQGNFYGTTLGGASNAGTVFELTPPASAGGTWTETVLHAFTSGSDGSEPYGSSVADDNGNLYGTTRGGGASNAGTVFEVTPAASGTWTGTVLHAFTGSADWGPFAGPIIDGKGNLSGTTIGGGASDAGWCRLPLTVALDRDGAARLYRRQRRRLSLWRPDRRSGQSVWDDRLRRRVKSRHSV